MSEWQPIESAPEGIAEVMLCYKPKNLIYIGYRSEHARTKQTGWVASQFTGSAEFCAFQPTHWAPLPSLPA